MTEYQARIPKLIDEKQELMDKIESMEGHIKKIEGDLKAKEV